MTRTILNAFERNMAESLELEKFLEKPHERPGKEKITKQQLYLDIVETVMKIKNNHGGGRLNSTDEELGKYYVAPWAKDDDDFVDHLQKNHVEIRNEEEIWRAARIFGKFVVEQYYKTKEVD